MVHYPCTVSEVVDIDYYTHQNKVSLVEILRPQQDLNDQNFVLVVHVFVEGGVLGYLQICWWDQVGQLVVL